MFAGPIGPAIVPWWLTMLELNIRITVDKPFSTINALSLISHLRAHVCHKVEVVHIL